MAERSVLIARSPSQATAWAEALAARGFRGIAHATFRLESMVGEAKAQRAIDDLDAFDWILLTGHNGLRYLRRGVEARGRRLADLDVAFGVVGPMTAEALAGDGVTARVVATEATAEGLAEALEDELDEDDRVLIVRPETTRPVLAERLERLGCEVHSVPFYRNRPADGIASVVGACDAGEFDAAVFGAPSAFEHLYDACGADAPEILAEIALVAIGEVTARAIAEHGCEVAATAAQPTPEGIAEAVAHALDD